MWNSKQKHTHFQGLKSTMILFIEQSNGIDESLQFPATTPILRMRDKKLRQLSSIHSTATIKIFTTRRTLLLLTMSILLSAFMKTVSTQVISNDHLGLNSNHQSTFHEHLPTDCNHVFPKSDEIIHGAYLEPHHIMKKRSLDQPLRIYLHYDDSVLKLSTEHRDLIKNTVLPKAVIYWEQTLMVRRTQKPILLNRRCPNQQVYYQREDPHPYCKLKCEHRTMCGEVEVPESHLDVCRICDGTGRSCKIQNGSRAGHGIDYADFIFYVSAKQTQRCKQGSTVAYAAHCQQESSLDRPIAGHANLCPKSISTKPQELDTLISTIKHEILHALGFSISLYAFYRDENGEPLTPRDSKGKPPLNEQMQARQWSNRTIREVIRTDWLVSGGRINRKVNMMVTPRVVEEVRRHFDCDDLEGAELEDQGEEGTALTHWEKRIFENEGMSGTHTQGTRYSRITLALMEDTGWYKANYDKAQTLLWGRGLGCNFVKKSCMEWIRNAMRHGQSPLPYCNRIKSEPLETKCTDDYASVALCNLVRYQEPLPPQYQNFDSETLPKVDNASYFGGSVALADYCPYIQEFTWRATNEIARGSNCHYEENNPDRDNNFALEEYGERSKCFYHWKDWEERSCHQRRHWQHWGSGCYRFTCSQGFLHLIVSNRTFICTYGGENLTIQLEVNDWLHQGGIICPDCSEFCDDCSGDLSGQYALDMKHAVDSLKCSVIKSQGYLVLIVLLCITNFTFAIRFS